MLIFLAEVAAYANGAGPAGPPPAALLVPARPIPRRAAGPARGAQAPSPLRGMEAARTRVWAPDDVAEDDSGSVGDLENMPGRAGVELTARLAPFADVDNIERAGAKRKREAMGAPALAMHA